MMPAHFKNQHIGENVLENAVLNTNRVHFLEFARVTGYYYVGIPTTVASSSYVVLYWPVAAKERGPRAFSARSRFVVAIFQACLNNANAHN